LTVLNVVKVKYSTVYWTDLADLVFDGALPISRSIQGYFISLCLNL